MFKSSTRSSIQTVLQLKYFHKYLSTTGDGVTELKPWRMASNWLKAPNKRTDLIERLRNDYFREGEQYLHINRKSYKQKPPPPPEKVYKGNNFLKPPVVVGSGGVTTNSTVKVEQQSVREENLNANKTTTTTIEHQDTIVGAGATLPPKTHQKVLEPIGPELRTEETPKLGFHHRHKKRTEVPLGPPKRPIDPQPFLGRKVIENGVLKASLLLVEELEREELEILARSLHEKLQLNCIPLIINPIR